MLSYNLYELLKNTKFVGVSLNLVRKFSKQILKALEFLARKHVDIIHCDLKPENVLLKHPKRSSIKLIDFGSSCLSTERKYTYIQSRFYRSPEILLGLPYDQKIDMWSLGCLLVEMHTGEPLFGGNDQCDQMCRIVDVLGMPPLAMLESSPPTTRGTFFEKIDTSLGMVPSADCDPLHVVSVDSEGKVYFILKRPSREAPRQQALKDIIGVTVGGPYSRRRGDEGHTEERYLEFLDFITYVPNPYLTLPITPPLPIALSTPLPNPFHPLYYPHSKLLIFDPVDRISAEGALHHPYLFAANLPPPVEEDTTGSKRSGRSEQGNSGQPRIRSRSAPSASDARQRSRSSPRDHECPRDKDEGYEGMVDEGDAGMEQDPYPQAATDSENTFHDTLSTSYK